MTFWWDVISLETLHLLSTSNLVSASSHSRPQIKTRIADISTHWRKGKSVFWAWRGGETKSLNNTVTKRRRASKRAIIQSNYGKSKRLQTDKEPRFASDTANRNKVGSNNSPLWACPWPCSPARRRCSSPSPTRAAGSSRWWWWPPAPPRCSCSRRPSLWPHGWCRFSANSRNQSALLKTAILAYGSGFCFVFSARKWLNIWKIM